MKTPHIKIRIESRIPSRLITVLKKEYGKGVRLVDDTETDEELIDVFQTDWYRRTKARLILARISDLPATQDDAGAAWKDDCPPEAVCFEHGK